jgi:hypothetical protein
MHLKTTITFALLALLPAAALAQAPQPSPEYKRLSYFAGTWSFDGAVKDTPLGPGGPITFKQTCELMEGGLALVCRSEGKNPMGPTKAVAIISYDAQQKAYTYTAAESNMPAFTAIGQVNGAVWTWNAEMTMGTQKIFTRVTQTEGGPKALDFAMELSLDGKTFARVIEGKLTKS